MMWVSDCQGKQDYDGSLVSVSSRYWPPNYRQDGLHSAESIVYVGKSEAVRQEFTDSTEAGVKLKVEAWVAERSLQVRLALSTAFVGA